MFAVSPLVRAYVCTVAVDMRKSFDGLSAAVSQILRCDPLSGHLFVFFNRRRTMVKILLWDRSGYSLYAKRLERGTFGCPRSQGEAAVAMTYADLSLILEGIEVSSVVRRPRYSLEAA